jgi:hypothetical protein
LGAFVPANIEVSEDDAIEELDFLAVANLDVRDIQNGILEIDLRFKQATICIQPDLSSRGDREPSEIMKKIGEIAFMHSFEKGTLTLQ